MLSVFSLVGLASFALPMQAVPAARALAAPAADLESGLLRLGDPAAHAVRSRAAWIDVRELRAPLTLETAGGLELALVAPDPRGLELLLRAPGEVVLADFGTAELTGGARGATGAAGTPLYFAPEQFQGAPSSPAIDLYAAGAILWEAATGRSLRSHADLMRGAAIADPLSAAGRAAIEDAHGPGLLRLLVFLLGDVTTRRSDVAAAAAVEIEL